MQGIYWLLTIPHANFIPYQPPSVQYIRGQLERGENTNYLHWQILVAFQRKCRLAAVTKVFGDGIHAELSRSSAATEYVWKSDTRVDGTQFELGTPALKRNCQADWDAVVDSAKRGRMELIPSDILVRNYSNLRRIHADYQEPVGVQREVVCYWGATGTGKSRRAWDEAGVDAYPKGTKYLYYILSYRSSD